MQSRHRRIVADNGKPQHYAWETGESSPDLVGEDETPQRPLTPDEVPLSLGGSPLWNLYPRKPGQAPSVGLGYPSTRVVIMAHRPPADTYLKVYGRRLTIGQPLDVAADGKTGDSAYHSAARPQDVSQKAQVKTPRWGLPAIAACARVHRHAEGRTPALRKVARVRLSSGIQSPRTSPVRATTCRALDRALCAVVV